MPKITKIAISGSRELKFCAPCGNYVAKIVMTVERLPHLLHGGEHHGTTGEVDKVGHDISKQIEGDGKEKLERYKERVRMNQQTNGYMR
jgi:hypothetical protein